MAFHRVLRWYLDLRNRADFALRRRIAWHRPGLAFENQSKEVLFRSLPEGERQECETRAAGLIGAYHLASFRDASTVDNFLENLYYLDLLEHALEAAGRPLPDEISAADVGCSSWFYVQALHALLNWWRCPEQRSVSLEGYEADPHRLYRNFHSRGDHALAHIRRLKGVTYRPTAFYRQPGRFDLITMLFPFVFVDDHLGWGLPAAMFSPATLLADAHASLKPGGLLVIVNQGEREHLRQRELLEEEGLSILAAGRHRQPLFYSYDIDRYFLAGSDER